MTFARKQIHRVFQELHVLIFIKDIGSQDNFNCQKKLIIFFIPSNYTLSIEIWNTFSKVIVFKSVTYKNIWMSRIRYQYIISTEMGLLKPKFIIERFLALYYVIFKMIGNEFPHMLFLQKISYYYSYIELLLLSSLSQH